MVDIIRYGARKVLLMVFGTALLVLMMVNGQQASAITPLPNPEPKPGSYGLEATKKQPPPTVGATITTPGNGASFTDTLVTVNGICPDGLLVQIYDNGVMVGSAMCTGGSFSIQISLFAGVNELTAIVYDDLEQAGPTSNVVTVNYTDTRFAAFGTLMTLTSAYGRRSAATGAQLTWPLQLSGGTGPYAFSLDWGDGGAAELKSQPLAGPVTIAHPYKKAGIYQVNVRATDINGVSAFLQVIAVSNGKVDGAGEDVEKQEVIVTRVVWIPALIAFLLLGPAYWLGRRSQLVTLHNKMLKEREGYARKK